MPKELPVDRKYELMIRDDLVINYIKKSMQWFRNCFDEALTNEVEQLKKQIKEKWNAGIYFPESTKQGVTDFWAVTREPYKAVVDARIGATLSIDLAKGGKITYTSFKDNGLISCPPHKIPIIIDPTILTLHDAQTVKDEVWEIVKPEIGKRKNTIKGRDFPKDLVDMLPVGYIKEKKTIKGRDFAVPAKEPKELAAVFRCGPDIFARNLCWYDLKQYGRLSFNLIALIEFGSKPEYKDQIFREHISRRKKLKPGHQKGASTIRAGYNMIYRAIKRKSAPIKEDDIPTNEMGRGLEKYNCPEHGESCSDYPDCAYREHYMADFDNKYKMPSLKERLFSRLKPSE